MCLNIYQINKSIKEIPIKIIVSFLFSTQSRWHLEFHVACACRQKKLTSNYELLDVPYSRKYSSYSFIAVRLSSIHMAIFIVILIIIILSNFTTFTGHV